MENEISSLTEELSARCTELEERNKAIEEQTSHRSQLEQDLATAQEASNQHKQAYEESHARYLSSSSEVS
jgi:hypothetical protein